MQYMIKLTRCSLLVVCVMYVQQGNGEGHIFVCLQTHKPLEHTRMPRVAPYLEEGNRNWAFEEKSGKKMSQNSFLPLLSYELHE